MMEKSLCWYLTSLLLLIKAGSASDPLVPPRLPAAVTMLLSKMVIALSIHTWVVTALMCLHKLREFVARGRYELP